MAVGIHCTVAEEVLRFDLAKVKVAVSIEMPVFDLSKFTKLMLCRNIYFSTKYRSKSAQMCQIVSKVADLQAHSQRHTSWFVVSL